MTFATLTEAQADRLLDLALDGESIDRIVDIAALELGVDIETAKRIVQEMHDHPIAKVVGRIAPDPTTFDGALYYTGMTRSDMERIHRIG